MRTKNMMYNSVMAMVYQIITLIAGLIFPRLYIITYGSEINGLVSSISQYISYFQYVEFGLGASLIFALYLPLAEKNKNEISGIATTARKLYTKSSKIYFGLVVLLAVIFPILVSKSSISFGMSMVLVLTIGAYGALDFYTLSKYRVLLTADQKYYVVNFASIIAYAINCIISYLLIINEFNIVFVKLIPIISLPIRSYILSRYIKSNYDYVNFYSDASYAVERQMRTDAMSFQISMSLMISLPMLIISAYSLKDASVFSIYYLVFMGITGVLSVFTMGSSASFGSVIASKDESLLKDVADQYDCLIEFIMTVLFLTTVIMGDSFIKIYTKGIQDATYFNPWYIILFTVWCVIYNARLSQTALVNGAGLYKETRRANIVQVVLLVVFCVILIPKMHIIGALISMIVVALFRTIDLMLLIDQKLLKGFFARSFFRMIRTLLVIIFVFSINWYMDFTVEVGLIQWMIISFCVVLLSTLFTISLYLIFDKPLILKICKRFIGTVCRG